MHIYNKRRFFSVILLFAVIVGSLLAFRFGYVPEIGRFFASETSVITPAWDLARQPELLANVYRLNDGAQFLYTTNSDTYPGFVKDGTVFAISTVSKSGMTTLYRLKGTNYLYTTSETERTALKQGGATDDGIVGYLFAAVSDGLVPLHSWRNTQTAERFLSLYKDMEGPAIEMQGYVYEGIIGYVFKNSTPQRIGVYYFGMFSPDAFDGRVRANIQAMYGNGVLPSQFWWSGVRDLFTHNLTPQIRAADAASEGYFAQDWSSLMPVIGWYDQSDPRTVEKHINQAISNGISYFNFYWYWDFDKGGEQYNTGLDSFLLARNHKNIDFSLAICEHGWNLTLPSGDFQRSADLLASKYFTQSNYLKTKDGKLIVQMCDPSGIRPSADAKAFQGYVGFDASMLQNFITTLRASAKRYTNREISLVVRMDATAPGLKESGFFNGGTCILPILDSIESAANYPKALEWESLQAGGWSFMPCFPEHIDERPRVGIIKAGSDIVFQTRPTVAQFADGLRKAKTWMESRPQDELSRFLTLYAWNEWHEGGILEPNVKDGAGYINQIVPVFDVPSISLACRVTGLCPDSGGSTPTPTPTPTPTQASPSLSVMPNPVCSPAVCANPPQDCYYRNADLCTCGSLVCVTVSPLPANPSPTAVTASTPSSPRRPTGQSPNQSSQASGDTDGDKDVDIFDYNVVVGDFGKDGTNLTGDLDDNGTVDIFDYNQVVSNFGHGV